MAETELQKIEKELKRLRERKQEILDEVRKQKEEKKSQRKQEVDEAYQKFIDLLTRYENDYHDYQLELSGKFSY